MTIIRHELTIGKKNLFLWTIGIALFLGICIFIYPEMKGQMEAMNKLFSAMGVFTAAFGMDKLDFGSLTGFYAVECGNILGIGGGFFTALIAIGALSKEEKEHTAEFLFSHPVRRRSVLIQKLAAVFLQVLLLNAVAYLTAIGSIICIGEPVPWNELTLLHFANLLTQFELALICFGLSACIRGNAFGIGLGLTLVFYFMNLVANISDQAEILKYLSPFGYAEGSDLLTDGLNVPLVLIGLLTGIVITCAGSIYYTHKDIGA